MLELNQKQNKPPNLTEALVLLNGAKNIENEYEAIRGIEDAQEFEEKVKNIGCRLKEVYELELVSTIFFTASFPLPWACALSDVIAIVIPPTNNVNTFQNRLRHLDPFLLLPRGSRCDWRRSCRFADGTGMGAGNGHNKAVTCTSVYKQRE